MSKQQAIPTRIAKYEIEKVLGKGAMGIVYKGLDAQIERHVAVKVLHTHLLEGDLGDDLTVRFQQEAKAAARCLHPNIVSVFDFGFHDERPYIAMEYVDGIELKAQLQSDSGYSLAVAADITIQILQALEHAHSKGVVHRDIKPANIILLENGCVKVSDFGVARLDTSDLTSTGFMVGTPNYMSPEGLQGLQVDQRSDLYSVGVLFYELLTQQRPVRGLSLNETIDSLDVHGHLSVQNINSIKPILRKALQPLAETRFQTATDFIKKLRNIDDMELADAKTSFYISPTAKTMVASAAASIRPPKPDTSASVWNAEVLGSLEQTLAKYVGPMAHYLVKKSSKKSQTMEGLSQILAQHIPTEQERQEFIQNLTSSGIYRAHTGSNATSTGNTTSGGRTSASLIFGLENNTKNASTALPSSSQSPKTISADDIKKVAEALVFYIGPLASRLAKRDAKKSTTLEDFHLRAAGNIPNKAEQQEFLKKLHV